MNILTVNDELLVAEHNFWTAREIDQQPKVWHQTQRAIEAQRPSFAPWLKARLVDPALRIVLTGAGSSAYIGETLAPWLRRTLARRVDAVASTDLLGAPESYLAEDVPTLMISFARSGDSPESVAAVELADRLLTTCHHLVLTCNADGALATQAEAIPEALCLLMPKRTNDRSFAMTSSFTAMLVAAASVFAPEPERLERAIAMAEVATSELVFGAKSLAETGFDRLVVLGAGCLFATAREACLKCLELTDGRVATLAETPLGVRHGPKAVIGADTAVVVLRSVDPSTARYDADLVAELRAENAAGEILELDPRNFADEADGMDDLHVSLPYLVFCQMLAFFTARVRGVAADEPCPSGAINRIVQGVTVHPYPG